MLPIRFRILILLNYLKVTVDGVEIEEADILEGLANSIVEKVETLDVGVTVTKQHR